MIKVLFVCLGNICRSPMADFVFKQMVAEKGLSDRFDLRYFNKRQVGELDFVVQKGNQVVPIEIKSGKDYKKHSSLNKVLEVGEWKLKQGLVFCMDNICKNGKITYLPWYMVMFFKQSSLSDLKVDLKIDI